MKYFSIIILSCLLLGCASEPVEIDPDWLTTNSITIDEPTMYVFSGEEVDPPILIIHYDGTIEWNGSQDEATLAFWNGVRDMIPELCKKWEQPNK